MFPEGRKHLWIGACGFWLAGCVAPFPPRAPRLPVVSPFSLPTPSNDRPFPSDLTEEDHFHVPLRNAVLLSPFGRRGRAFHSGVDLRGRRGGGDIVRAARKGVVVMAGPMHGYGKMVTLEHGDKSYTRYAHLKTITVKIGQTVDALASLGRVGSTGRATTPHLHFEIISPHGEFLDPLPLLTGTSKTAADSTKK